MILIDSLYINDSGGFRLLRYLVQELRKRGVDFYLLADSRCAGAFDELPAVEYMRASMSNRVRWYRRDMSGFSSVLLPAYARKICPGVTFVFLSCPLTDKQTMRNKNNKILFIIIQTLIVYFDNIHIAFRAPPALPHSDSHHQAFR